MKRIGKKICEVCKERASVGIIQKRFVCRQCYYSIQGLQAQNGYSKKFFKMRKLKLKVLNPSEILKTVRKDYAIKNNFGGG